MNIKQDDSKKANGLGITGFVLSLVSFFPFYGIPAGVIGLILSAVGNNNAKRGIVKNRGLALSGLIISIVSLCLQIIWILITVLAIVYIENSN